MNGMAADDPPDRSQELPETLLEQAAIWHARMREPDVDPAAQDGRRAAFERWLAADPRHRQAFAEAERLWDALEAPVARVLAAESAILQSARQDERRPMWLAPRLAALAACLVVAIGAGLFWRDDVLDRLRSDRMTAVGEHAPLVLEDGSRITLNTDTAVALDLRPDRREVRLFRGEAWFDVAPGDGRPFVVATKSGSIRATGTSFDVRLDGDTAVVSLTEGGVELTSAGDGTSKSAVALQPGQQARMAAGVVSAAASFDRTAVTAWLRSQLVFYDAPLAAVVAELNRYRPGRIVVVNGALDGVKVSGVFRTDDPEAALSVMADTLPIRVLRLTDYLVLLR